MVIQGTPGNDAGLLEVIAGIREAMDHIVEIFSEHHGIHPDHSVTQCPALTLYVGHLLTELGGSAAVSGANLIDKHISIMGIALGNDYPIDLWPNEEDEDND